MKAHRPWAWPLVPVYAAALAVKNALRRAGVLQTRKLQWPVVSVGSLSAGGAGKTPVAIALATLLRERGWNVDVLSRGYGREERGVELVSQEAPDAAKRFGDEPVLIAQRAGVPVWVDADRFAAGVKAETDSIAAAIKKQALREAQGDDFKSGHPVHLLDDGFQHRRLARSFDIVLVTAEDLQDALLPAGNLREPPAAMRRADVAVVREEEMESVEPKLRPLLREDALVWTVRRSLRFPAPLFVFGAGLRPVAFCAIARPEGFAAMLVQAGCGVVETVFFADHHAYSMADIERVIEVARGLNATGLVTTEKDAVKLTAAMRSKLEAFGLLLVVALEAEFLYPERVARELEARLA